MPLAAVRNAAAYLHFAIPAHAAYEPSSAFMSISLAGSLCPSACGH